MGIQTPNGFTLDNSGKRVVVDPVTRIEGHLRVEVNVDAQNVIRNAVSTGTMWRGIELILKGRDPRDAWAFAQRICGVCTGTHALTSVRTVEDALGIKIPENANTIRNIMQLALYVHDHLVHFYHLHALDWVDVVSALSADPKATSALAQSISAWPMSSPGYFRDVQGRLKRFVRVGPARPVPQRLLGPPGLQAAGRSQSDGGGALPGSAGFPEGHRAHPHGVRRQEPAPELAGRRRARAINIDDTGAVGAAVNMTTLNLVSDIIDRALTFTEQVYLPDLKAIASFYKDWLYGGGLAGRSMLAYGDMPEHANDYSPASLLLPQGAIINGNLNEVLPIDLKDPAQIQEFVTHSWYKYPDGVNALHPFDGVTEPAYALGPNTKGSRTDIQEIDEGAKYSWLKAPRWRGHAMEVGPLARFVIGYAQNKPQFREPVEKLLTDLGVPVSALFSTLGRTAARGLEAQWAAHELKRFYGKLIASIKAGDLATANVEKWAPDTWPANRAAPASPKPPAARWRTGCISRAAKSKTTSAWCRPPGTARRATRPAISAPSRRR